VAWAWLDLLPGDQVVDQLHTLDDYLSLCFIFLQPRCNYYLFFFCLQVTIEADMKKRDRIKLVLV
jgi:hypothetical protein